MASTIEQRYFDLHTGSAERWATARDIFPDGVTPTGGVCPRSRSTAPTEKAA